LAAKPDLVVTNYLLLIHNIIEMILVWLSCQDWEMLVLSKLKFDLSPVLAFDFLDILLDRLRLPKETQVYLRGLAVSYINILPLGE